MNNKYPEFKIEAPFKINLNLLISYFKNCQNEEELIQCIFKTKHFEKLFLTQNDNLITIQGTSVPQFPKFNILPNKKNFFGLLFENKVYNFTGRLDSLNFKLQMDFPFISPDLMVFQNLKNKYYDKNLIKFEYRIIPGWYKDPIILSLSKGNKNDFNYLNFKINFKKFIGIKNDEKFDVSFAKKLRNFSKTEFSDMNEVKLKYKNSTINQSLIKNGYFNKIILKQSFLSPNNVFSFHWTYQNFQSLDFLQKYAVLEFQNSSLYTNQVYNLSYNLLGFRNKNIFYNEGQNIFEQFLALKCNFFQEKFIQNIKMIPFIYLSSLYQTNQGLKLRYGFGLQKKLTKNGKLEVCYDIFQNLAQIRFVKESDQLISNKKIYLYIM